METKLNINLVHIDRKPFPTEITDMGKCRVEMVGDKEVIDYILVKLVNDEDLRVS